VPAGQVGGRWDPSVFNLIWKLDYPPAGGGVANLTRITEPL